MSGVDLGLSWWLARVTGATSYEVKLGPRGAVTTPSSPPHAHLFTGIWAVREEHTLYVRARNSGGASDWAWITYSGSNPPLALTGLSATATSTSLTLSWTSAPSNKTTYEVKLGASGTVATVAATGHTFTTHYGTGDKAASELNHTFTGLTGGTEYTLYVRAKNSGGTSPWSSISATTSLAAPNGLSVTATLSSLTLSWNSVTGATSYEVKQGASGAVTAIASGTSHTFTGLEAGTEYSLYVRAKSSDEASEWSSLNVAPWLFTLSATATDTGLTLSWTAVPDATGYEVKVTGYVYDERGTTPMVQRATVSSGTTSHTFTGLTAISPYMLYVRARSSTGVSEWSSHSVWFGAGPLQFTLSATATDTSLTLSWIAVPDVTNHEVKLGADGVVTTVTSGANHTFTGLTANTSYTLYMRTPEIKGHIGNPDWSSISIATLPR